MNCYLLISIEVLIIQIRVDDVSLEGERLFEWYVHILNG